MAKGYPGPGFPCGSYKEKVLLIDGKIHVLRPAKDMRGQRKKWESVWTPVVKHWVSDSKKGVNLPHMFWMVPWGKTRKI